MALKPSLQRRASGATETYTHVSKKDISKVPSPLDGLKW
jgi:hypothetical protein